MSATTSASSTEVCDGENLAIILAIYWIVYLIINAVIFAVAMYALRRCFSSDKPSDEKSKSKRDDVSRSSSRMSLVSRSQN